MKLCVAVLLLTVGLSWATIINTSGQPGCKTDIEMNTVAYRNYWDPTSYWRCVQRGVPASSAKCPDGEGWVDSKKACVAWDAWEWEEHVLPPSSA